MEKLFLPYDLSLLMRDKGFAEKCLGYFDTETQESFLWNRYNDIPMNNGDWAIDMPTWEQAKQWLCERGVWCANKIQVSQKPTEYKITVKCGNNEVFINTSTGEVTVSECVCISGAEYEKQRYKEFETAINLLPNVKIL